MWTWLNSYLPFETLFWRTWPYYHQYHKFFSIWRHLSIFIQTKQSFILYSKNLLFLMMISTTFVLFLIWTLFPKFSRKLLPLVSSFTYCLIPYLLHSNLPIACSIPLKPHFLGIHNDLILAMDRGEVTSSYSSWFICCLRYCRSFHPSSSSSTLVWSSWYFSWLVLILSHLTFSSSLHPKFHFIFLKSFLWCTSRFRPWSTSFLSLYNSSWLCHLEELNQVPPLCCWYPTVHFFHLTPSLLLP